eukprot:a340215_218.p2 GENE.a340215_218~~a340215_218.p2  ORF type:complete len:232 (+),score=96.54 a340215_218:80-697(+)
MAIVVAVVSAQDEGDMAPAPAKTYQEHFNQVQKLQSEAIEKVLALGDWSKQKAALPKILGAVFQALAQARELSDQLRAEKSAAGEGELSEALKAKEFKVFSLNVENGVFAAQILRMFPRARELIQVVEAANIEAAFAFCKAAKLDPAFLKMFEEATVVLRMSPADIEARLKSAGAAAGSAAASKEETKADRAKRVREAARARRRN